MNFMGANPDEDDIDFRIDCRNQGEYLRRHASGLSPLDIDALMLCNSSHSIRYAELAAYIQDKTCGAWGYTYLESDIRPQIVRLLELGLLKYTRHKELEYALERRRMDCSRKGYDAIRSYALQIGMNSGYFDAGFRGTTRELNQLLYPHVQSGTARTRSKAEVEAEVLRKMRATGAFQENPNANATF
jgi:hypothetical protein